MHYRESPPACDILLIFLARMDATFCCLSRLFGGQAEFYLTGIGFKSAAGILLLEFVHGFLYTGGINEEDGWRGDLCNRTWQDVEKTSKREPGSLSDGPPAQPNELDGTRTTAIENVSYGLSHQ